MVKNLLSNEQDTSLIPGPRTKIPQASGQLRRGDGDPERSSTLPRGAQEATTLGHRSSGFCVYTILLHGILSLST